MTERKFHPDFIKRFVREPLQGEVWKRVESGQIVLNESIPDDRWTEVCGNKIPHLKLGHVLAASSVVYLHPIPKRVKNFISIEASDAVRSELNRWNRDTAHLYKIYPYGDVRIKRPLMAIVHSLVDPYINDKAKHDETTILKLAICLFGIGVDYQLQNVLKSTQ